MGAPRVLHLSYYDIHGGAARATYRLHEGLRAEGVESRMLVRRKFGADDDVQESDWSTADRVINRLTLEAGLQYVYLPASSALLRHRWLQEADVVQLGNIHGGMFAHTALPRLTRTKPVVWCLHDMWAFTGHCGFSFESERWLTGCGRCPHLDSYPAIPRDATRLNWKLKKQVYARSRFTLVTPSEWLAGLARKSPLLAGFDVHVIPYGVDTDIFTPQDKGLARRELGIPNDARVLLVIGLERRKGGDLLPEILGLAAAEHRIDLLVAGSTAPAELPANVFVHLLGELTEEQAMARAYAAADVYLLPTRGDNLPNTLIESLACGRPVVTTAVGGVPEIVADGVSGFVRTVDPRALGEALTVLLDDPGLQARLGAAGREQMLRRFTLESQARGYLEVYGHVSETFRVAA
jgi:glycosyltransferase involved in cell wall biosynthesis